MMLPWTRSLQAVSNRAEGAEQRGLARKGSARVPTIAKRRMPDEVQQSLPLSGPNHNRTFRVEGLGKDGVLSAECSSMLISMRCIGTTQD